MHPCQTKLDEVGPKPRVLVDRGNLALRMAIAGMNMAISIKLLPNGEMLLSIPPSGSHDDAT